MFTLSHPHQARHCQGFSRREFLRIGTLCLGGLTLPGLLAARARAAASRLPITDKSVVFLFLQGGPTQIETFDPKMTAPAEIRSITGEVQTALPGVTFGGTFGKLARLADRLAVVRSFASGNGDHQNLLAVAGGNRLKAAMGSLYARVAGRVNAGTGLPTSIFVPPEATQTGMKLGSNFETKALPQLASAGELGETYKAFDPSGGGPLLESLELKIAPERFGDRRTLLRSLDTFKRRLDATGELDTLDTYQQQAHDIILRGVHQAFDLSKEDPKTIERYDTSKLFNVTDYQKFGDMRRSTNLLGRQMLLARRLCEAGCGFVMVSDSGWDMHSNGNSPKNLAGIQALGNQVDHAVAAFLADIHERGLSDRILLVVSGEMGRTPKINKNGGRDHWANLTPLLLAGGGLKMGQIIGQSDANAGTPATEKYTPSHLLATVMHTLFDVGQVRVTPGLPPDLVSVITGGFPIRELIGS
jgi:hypothetical protein